MMTENTSLRNFFIIFSMMIILAGYPVQVAGFPDGPDVISVKGIEPDNTLVIAERDVLSFSLNPRINETANLTLLNYHETWIFNTYDQVKTIDVVCPISKEKYQPSSGYPAFGKRYLIQQSSIPDYIAPKATRILETPAVKDGSNTVYFTWENVKIDPHEAVIVAYADEFQNGSDIYHAGAIEIPGVNITRTYEGSGSVLVMNYSLENTEKFRLHSPKFILFFPEFINNDQIFQPSNITIRSNCRMDIFENTTYNDGSGYFSTGHMMLSQCPEYLQSAQTNNFNVEIEGRNSHAGRLIPSFVISYKADDDLFNQTGEVKRIWPAVDIIPQENLNITRLYYYEVSLAIPEIKSFIIVPDTPSKTHSSIFNNFIFYNHLNYMFKS
jgi:hypothetical protein